MDAYILDHAKLECEGNANCKMFVDYLGTGVNFKMCPTGSSPIGDEKGGSILYENGNTNALSTHQIPSQNLPCLFYQTHLG